MEEKLRKAQFTLEDFLEQIQQVQKMGPMGQLMGMIPGMGGMAKEAQEAVDRGDLQAGRGDHPVDDAARAARPGRHQRLAPAADRGRVRRPA